MARSQDVGARGEALAAELLRGGGWTVLDRNWRFRHKEIDLVVERAGTVAFVEVKARSGTAFGHPLEAVTARKRLDLAVAARAWIARHGRTGQTYRFDAVWVLRRGGRVSVRHVEDAWRL
ncbi:MAG TPA: YraN family protein [Longimicrobiales bacterium]|nr:YraN family protein [Longimicrobiales bacterium]